MNNLITNKDGFIRLERYSFDGFTPQYQKHHLQTYKKQCNINPYNYTGLQRHYIIQFRNTTLKFQKAHLQDFVFGIWAFFAGHKNNQSLNHLKHKVPKYYAWLPEDVIVYDVNWQKYMQLKDAFCQFGIYIPKRSLEKIIVE